MKRFFRAMTSSFVYSKDGDDEQARLIAPALINTVQIGISCNTIAPDAPSSFSRKFLKDKYLIVDRDSLLRRINEFFYHFNDETLNASTRFGSITQSAVFTNIVKMYYDEYGEISSVRKALEDAAYDEQSFIDFSYLRRFDVFVSSMQTLNEKGLLSGGLDTLKVLPVDAYYDGLSVTLVRMGVGASYLTEDDAREILADISNTTHDQYCSWGEFAAGYMIERAGFTDHVIEPLVDIALTCLNDEKSPWRRWGF